jgi:hypothetical protein
VAGGVRRRKGGGASDAPLPAVRGAKRVSDREGEPENTRGWLGVLVGSLSAHFGFDGR